MHVPDACVLVALLTSLDFKYSSQSRNFVLYATNTSEFSNKNQVGMFPNFAILKNSNIHLIKSFFFWDTDCIHNSEVPNLQNKRSHTSRKRGLGGIKRISTIGESQSKA